MTGRIVILGAGPTGLGAAHRLTELGHDDWDIFEGSDHVGGLASSVTDDHGFIWDHGGHVMFSHYTTSTTSSTGCSAMTTTSTCARHGSGSTAVSCRIRSRTTSTGCRRTSSSIASWASSRPGARQARQLRPVDHVGLRRGHRRPLHAAVQLEGLGPPAGDDGHQLAGRPGADRRPSTHPAEPPRRSR